MSSSFGTSISTRMCIARHINIIATKIYNDNDDGFITVTVIGNMNLAAL